MKTSVFCTVISKTRLIQGIACFLSLYETMDNFIIYVLCVDNKCYEFLKKIDFNRIKLFRISELNRDDLLELESKRLLNQYCWTLKPGFIRYILEMDNSIERVTYIDSDLFFLQDVKIVFDNQPNASILLSSGEIFLPMHSKEFNLYMQYLTGKYNSGFISFKNDIDGRACVKWWDRKCVESCTANPEDNKFGDQKYLEDMPLLFRNVEEITTLGVNIGHWNYPKYRFNINNNIIMVDNNKLIFYHFSGFRIVDKNDIRQVHEEDRINKPFIYQIYRKILRDIIEEVEKIDPTFTEYKTIAEVEDN